LIPTGIYVYRYLVMKVRCEDLHVYVAGDLESPKAKSKARSDEARRGQVETALVEKHLKTKLAVAADHFNRDYRKGIQYLQVCILLLFLDLCGIPINRAQVVLPDLYMSQTATSDDPFEYML
jgi:hypothetical protein